MTIAVFGGYGFLGKKLVTSCLKNTKWNVIVISRSSRSNYWDEEYDSRIFPKFGDIRDYDFVCSVLEKVDVAYYFVHFMGHKNIDMYKEEADAAKLFAKAAKAKNLKKLIYMGGLNSGDDYTSSHLRSRFQTGVELRKIAPLVIELRASVIIGKGSVSFDIIDSLARKLPFIILPKSSSTKTQPIAVDDVISYLTEAATYKFKANTIFEIGGADVLSYKELYLEYLDFIDKKQRVYVWPLITPGIESKLLNLLIPKVHARIGKEIMESLTTEMLVTNDKAYEIFPKIKPVGLKEAFTEALN